LNDLGDLTNENPYTRPSQSDGLPTRPAPVARDLPSRITELSSQQTQKRNSSGSSRGRGRGRGRGSRGEKGDERGGEIVGEAS